MTSTEPEMVQLADGREVPKWAVDALTRFEEKWPGTTLRVARPAIAAAVLEALEAQEDIVIEEEVAKGLGLKSLSVEDGNVSLQTVTKGVAERTVLVMLDGLADMLEDATNYVEFDLRRQGKTPVSVCVRRYAHPTPHELRTKAERERDELAEALRLTVEYVGTDTLPPTEGWEWWDALKKIKPDVAQQFITAGGQDV